MSFLHNHRKGKTTIIVGMGALKQGESTLKKMMVMADSGQIGFRVLKAHPGTLASL